jgi:oxygen-dependent protoporphyrinogen oxidase
MDFFSGVTYSHIVTTHLFLDMPPNLPDYYGVFYPSLEVDTIACVTMQSKRNLSRSQKTRQSISICPSNEFSEEIFELSDRDVQETVVSKLESLYPFAGLHLSGAVSHSKIVRTACALPEFHVGYIRALKCFQEDISKSLPPGLFFAGDYVGGPSIEGAISSGERILPQLMGYLTGLGSF